MRTIEVQHVWTSAPWKTFVADSSMLGLQSSACLFICDILAFFFFLIFHEQQV